MKRYILLLLAAAVCLAGCGKEPSEQMDITGVWNICGIEQITKSAVIGDETIDVYIEFRSDNSFSMYQMLGAGSFRSYTGTWTLSGSTLNGTYSDKSSWGAAYEVSVDSGIMTMSSAGEIYTYKKVDRIPDNVLAY